MAQSVPALKRAKIVKPTLAPKEVVILSIVPKRAKTRATKANLKIGEKEWSISFIGNMESALTSSSDSGSTEDALIFLFHKRPYFTPKQCPPPSPAHLDKFRRFVK